jgi:peptide/nickel transport system permease protein
MGERDALNGTSKRFQTRLMHTLRGRGSVGLTTYVIKRSLIIIPKFFLISIIIFTLLNLAPRSDPITIIFADNSVYGITPELIDKLIEEYGRDQPFFVQYLVWIGKLVRGDFGYSYVYNQPVIEMISIRVPPTLELMLMVQALSLVLAIILGVVSAVKQYSLTDALAKVGALIGYSAPSFWLGLIGIIVFAGYLKWLPAFGTQTVGIEFPTIFHVWFDHFKHLFLPVTILSFGWMAYLLRLVRSSMLEVLRSDYILTARAKGLSERVVIYKHALRNALLPVVTYEGYAVGFLLSGAAVIESVFSWPGLGTFMVEAATNRDYPTLMGLSMIITLMVLISNLVADLSYAVVDPRIRYE